MIAKHIRKHAERHHKAAQDQSTEILLRDIPEKGGYCDRQILERLVREAFMGGVSAELASPMLGRS